MIDTNPGNGYGPFGSTFRTAGPKRFRKERAMHFNTEADDEDESED
jgi:hypothetical protein